MEIRKTKSGLIPVYYTPKGEYSIGNNAFKDSIYRRFYITESILKDNFAYIGKKVLLEIERRKSW